MAKERFKRAYVEITNTCNLDCCFCPKTKRAPRRMSVAEFSAVAQKLRGYTSYLYLHVMGEPLSHPDLARILEVGARAGYHLHITTNGTLLRTHTALLAGAQGIRKISVSLHSFEGNGGEDLVSYLDGVMGLYSALRAAGSPAYLALRLWNAGGAEERNGEILDYLSRTLGTDVRALPVRCGSRTVGERLFLEEAEKFDWPVDAQGERDVRFCHGLSDQIGILADGTVVPCCLDSEGALALGNIFTEDLSDILASPRARAMLDGFRRGAPAEDLCRRCGYATRFTKGT